MKSAAALAIFTICSLYAQNPETKGRFFAGNTPLTEPAGGPPEDIARRVLESTASELSLTPSDSAGGDCGRVIEGRRMWFGLRGALRLAWAFTVTDQDSVSRYSVVVEDGSGAILDKSELTFFATPPVGQVFDKGSPQPNPTPGIRL